jgi:hypothetical protein
VLACFVWLQFRDPHLKDRLFSDPTLDGERIGKIGIIDDDIDYHDRRVINESDREIETETSNPSLYLYFRTLYGCEYPTQCNVGLHECFSFRRGP